MSVGCHRFPQSLGVQVERRGHGQHNGHQREQQAKCLQRVGPHDGAYAAAVRVEPDEAHGGCRRRCKGYAVGVEDEFLQDETHQIEPQRGAQQLGYEEERSSRAVGLASQPVAEVGVDGSQVEPVIEREQHVGNDDVAREETHARLQVGHVDASHHARDGDKRDSGQ